MTVISAQLAEQIGVVAACQALGIPRSRIYTAHRSQTVKASQPSARALTAEERQQVRDVLNSERFWDQPPRQVYATLLDEGTHLCLWRTMYRILAPLPVATALVTVLLVANRELVVPHFAYAAMQERGAKPAGQRVESVYDHSTRISIDGARLELADDLACPLVHEGDVGADDHV